MKRLAGNRSARWAFMERFEVPNLDDPTQTYLTRLRIVQTPWFAIYLHRMDGPDSRPTLHDHPWNFVSLILRGGYSERRFDPQDMRVFRRRVHHVNVMRTHDAHAIEHLFRVPTWTLLLVGPRRRTWGYWEGPVSDDQRWRWTPFNTHRHAYEFDRAMAARKEASR